MKELKRNVILSSIIAIIALIILSKGVYGTTVAMQTIPTSNNNTINNTTANAVTLNSNVAKDNQVTPAPVVNTVTPTNTVTTVPQTGEYDTYIIAGIAIVVVSIGAFSFINTRKYSK